MKIVVDTNVFVSGVYWNGPPYQILQRWEKGHFKLIVSPPILDEYRRVLIELSIHKPEIQFERALALVDLHAEVVKPILMVRILGSLGYKAKISLQRLHKISCQSTYPQNGHCIEFILSP